MGIYKLLFGTTRPAAAASPAAECNDLAIAPAILKLYVCCKHSKYLELLNFSTAFMVKMQQDDGHSLAMTVWHELKTIFGKKLMDCARRGAGKDEDLLERALDRLQLVVETHTGHFFMADIYDQESLIREFTKFKLAKNTARLDAYNTKLHTFDPPVLIVVHPYDVKFDLCRRRKDDLAGFVVPQTYDWVCTAKRGKLAIPGSRIEEVISHEGLRVCSGDPRGTVANVESRGFLIGYGATLATAGTTRPYRMFLHTSDVNISFASNTPRDDHMVIRCCNFNNKYFGISGSPLVVNGVVIGVYSRDHASAGIFSALYKNSDMFALTHAERAVRGAMRDATTRWRANRYAETARAAMRDATTRWRANTREAAATARAAMKLTGAQVSFSPHIPVIPIINQGATNA